MQPHRSITQPSKDAKQRGAYQPVLARRMAWHRKEKQQDEDAGSSIASASIAATTTTSFGDETTRMEAE